MKKKGSSAESTGSSLEESSSESSLDSSESSQVFEEMQKVRTIARKAAGLLTYGMVKENAESEAVAGTLWIVSASHALQYYRTQLGN